MAQPEGLSDADPVYVGRDFTWEVVARLPADGFRLTRTEVLAWLEQRPEST